MRYKNILIGLPIVIGLGAGIVWWSRHKPEKLPEFETTAIDRGPLEAKVTATGTLSAVVTVQVGSQLSGRLEEIGVDFNSVVKKGQVIARIDPRLFEAALASAQANHTAAKGNLAKAVAQAEQAKKQLERTRKMVTDRLVSEAELDNATANADAAAAQVIANQGGVAQTQAALHQAEVNLRMTKIISPIDGVVISRSVDVGQTVASSFQTPTLFVIAEDLKKMQVNTSVAEADIGRLQSGMHASFTVDAFPSERFEGVVRPIRNAPQTLQNIVTYDAVVDVSNSDMKLRPGMTANVTFVYAKRDDVLRIANSALRVKPDPEIWKTLGLSLPNTKPASRNVAPENRQVWMLINQKPKVISLTVGLSDGTRTEIREGSLKSGDLVITNHKAAGGPAAGGGRGGMRRMM